MQAKTIDEVIKELDEIISHSITNNSRHGYFAALYKRVTCSVANKIKEGYFEDNERMENLDVIFANYYLAAYRQYTTGEKCSAPWATAFTATEDWSPMIIHHLLAGMNAHIGLDLGIATAKVSKGYPLQLIQNDFNKINVLLNAMTNEVKQELYSMWPLSKLITRFKMGKVENAVAAFSMGLAREAAWDVAVQYTVKKTPEDERNYVSSRGINVAAFSDKILNPTLWLQVVLFLCRSFETGTIAGKIKKLGQQH